MGGCIHVCVSIYLSICYFLQKTKNLGKGIHLNILPVMSKVIYIYKYIFRVIYMSVCVCVCV